MSDVRFDWVYKEHLEQLPSCIDCLGFPLARSYQTNQNDRMIS